VHHPSGCYPGITGLTSLGKGEGGRDGPHAHAVRTRVGAVLARLSGARASAPAPLRGAIQLGFLRSSRNRPPGNPGNWHTITINDTAWSAHQAHGDLIGSCVSNCGTLCDDGNKCTIDFLPSSTECLCQAAPRPAVDCSDGLACTTDSCDPTQGCANTPVVCQAPDRCTASVCSEPDGTCQNTPVACPTGQACNPSTGACEGTLPKCGNCITTHDSPGCEVAACQARVCGFSPMCCTDSWTEGNGGPCEQQGYFSCALGGLCTP
jgi:hypothetical protein